MRVGRQVECLVEGLDGQCRLPLLDGRAGLLRRSFTAGERIEEIALRFDQPLRVGDAFASVVPATRVKTPQPA